MSPKAASAQHPVPDSDPNPVQAYTGQLPQLGGICPECGHPEKDHVYVAADEACDGWAHCKIEKGKSACQCWRSWPKMHPEL